MAGAAVTNPPASPSHSPRLPSPPPLTEVQFGPRSPGLGGVGDSGNSPGGSGTTAKGGHTVDLTGGSTTSSNDGGLGSPPSTATSTKSTRRIRPGTSAEEMSAGPPLVSLSDLDSAFQLQEHLKSLYYTYTQPAGSSHTVPITHSTALELATPPDGVDKSLWLYELCRLLTLKLNTIVVAFFTDNPPCSAATCPEMRASEWQYLCAVHDPPKPCCAIDYSCHTLDWAANMLSSPKHFPSRLTLGGSGSGTTAYNAQDKGDASGSGASGSAQHQQGLRNLTNICRRLYRIFAHAWYQHRAVFWQVESMTGLYVFFKTVCDMYQLIPEDNYTVPAEAEGGDSTVPSDDAGARGDGGDHAGATTTSSGGGGEQRDKHIPAPTILRKQAAHAARPLSTVDTTEGNNTAGTTASTSSGTDVAAGSSTAAPAIHPGKVATRRSMSSLPIGSSSSGVTPVPEEEENDVGKADGEKDVGEDGEKRETEEHTEPKHDGDGKEGKDESQNEQESSDPAPPESLGTDEGDSKDSAQSIPEENKEPSKEEPPTPQEPDASPAPSATSPEANEVQEHKREPEEDEGHSGDGGDDIVVEDKTFESKKETDDSPQAVTDLETAGPPEEAKDDQGDGKSQEET